jgi:murein DD-endopeptidase MepM/ murein hydrolase activator NlpD
MNMKKINKIILYCLVLFIIYPLSPAAFKWFLSIKEKEFIYPLLNGGAIRVRSDVRGEGHFGARRSNGRRRHKGLDMAAYIGQPVVAAKSGMARSGEVLNGMGKYIKISHPDGYVTIYGHLSQIEIPDRCWVWQGQRIALAGKSGNASHPKIEAHLHFEIRKESIALDPLLYLNNTKT